MNSELRLNLGCGNNLLHGYVNIDKFDEAADVKADICELPYDDNSVDEIVAYQVIEHLPYWKTHYVQNSIGTFYEPVFFQECYRVLKPSAKMITECPDLEVLAERIVKDGLLEYTTITGLWGEYYRPWDKNRYKDWEHQAGSLHINGFTFLEIMKIAEHVGFKVRKQGMEEKHPNYKYEDNLSVEWTK